MKRKPTAEVPVTQEEKVAMAGELLKHPAWEYFFRPYLEGLASKHALACQSRQLSSEKRAEHIEAANILPEIIGHPASVIEAAKLRDKNN